MWFKEYTNCEVDMTELSKLVGKRIRELRESKNIKQYKLAEMINFEPTNLSKIEKGVHLPKEETIYKLTDALSCNVKDLFDFEHLKDKAILKQELLSSIKNDEVDIILLYKLFSAIK